MLPLTVRPCAASQVDIEVTGGKKMEHTGIKIELIGHIGARCCLHPPPSTLARATVRGQRRSACSPPHRPQPAPSPPPPCLCSCLPVAELLYDRSNTFEFTSLV